MQSSIGLPGILAALVIGCMCVSSLQRWDSGKAGGKLSVGGAGANDVLRFRPDGTFKILQITDIHYGEMNATLDDMSDEVQRILLAAEQPDLVVFSGDLVSGWVCPPGRPDPPGGAACSRPRWWHERWEQLTGPVRAAGHPWAIVLGNHDAEGPLDRRQVIDLAVRTGGPWGLTRQGPAAATGASNYWLDVHPPLTPGGSGGSASGSGSSGGSRIGLGAGGGGRGSGSGDSGSGTDSGVPAGTSGGSGASSSSSTASGGSGSTASGSSTGGGGGGVAGGDGPAARVWLLDSMDRTCPPLMYGWGCVADDTLAWLNSTAHSLPRVPSLAFVHIPIPQFTEVWADGPTVGSKLEDVACSARDTGLFSLAREIGVNAIYSGHDHNNDYVGVMEGVRLAYGRKSGHGGYGPPQGWLRGARVIELRMGQDTSESKTWIRQEDGTTVSQSRSQQAKEMHQLVCHCDELGAQPELKDRLAGVLAKQAGRSPSEVLAELLLA